MKIISTMLKMVPKPVRRSLSYGNARYCPVCESWVNKFFAAGTPRRNDARCPVCFSLERHRLMWLFLKQRTNLFDGRPKHMLHVSPELQLGQLMKKACGSGYLSIDIDPKKAMMPADITRLPFDEDHFDVIYCSHVLEHIPDDRKAMSELRRVLKTSGWAILQVPIKGAHTFEDFTATTPEERLKQFGQVDHVRTYGADYQDRLVESGFKVTADQYAKELREDQARLNSIQRDEIIFFCRK